MSLHWQDCASCLKPTDTAMCPPVDLCHESNSDPRPVSQLPFQSHSTCGDPAPPQTLAQQETHLIPRSPVPFHKDCFQHKGTSLHLYNFQPLVIPKTIPDFSFPHLSHNVLGTDLDLSVRHFKQCKYNRKRDGENKSTSVFLLFISIPQTLKTCRESSFF